MIQWIIEVTERDILRGIRRDSTSCPIAQAVQRQLDKIDICEVSDNLYLVVDPQIGRTVEVALPQEAFDFIEDFDKGADVGPRRFIVEVPPEAVEALPIPDVPIIAPGQVTAGLVP